MKLISVDEAVAALEAAAWTENGPEYDACARCGYREKEPRTRIHCLASGIGADWDASDAVEFLRGADEIAWAWSLTSHDLKARNGDLVRSFEVRAPEYVRAELLETRGR